MQDGHPVLDGRVRCEQVIVPESKMVDTGVECGGSPGFGWTQFHRLG